jgi:hypothetical protein
MANQQDQKPQEAHVQQASKAEPGSSGNGARVAKEAVDRPAAPAERAPDAVAENAREATTALTTSYGVFAEGIQELQQGYWQIFQQSLDLATSAPAELMRCRNLMEVAEIQRGLLHRYLDRVADASRTLMDVSGRVIDTATRPLREHIGNTAHRA